MHFSPHSSSRRDPASPSDPSRTCAAKACATTVGAIDPDVLSFTVGKDPVLDLDLVEWDCLGSAAHATMLAKMKFTPRIFSVEERDAVVAELAKIAADARAGRFAITEADQDCHLAIERTLTERLGDLGRRVHTGRSRNDQVATALRLYGRDQLLGVYDETLALAHGLVEFGFRHKLVPMVGRTHLQPAMPSTIGLWATSFAESLLDDLFAVVWKPLGSSDQRQDLLRRQLQRTYVANLNNMLNNSNNTTDVILYLQQHLNRVKNYCRQHTGSDLNGLHYADLMRQIQLIEDRQTKIK